MNDGIPAGYERVSLIEALNGPTFTKRFPAVPSPTSEALLDPASSIASVVHFSVVVNE